MFDKAEINGQIKDNICIPELIVTNTKASSKFDTTSDTVGMNGLGLKVIIPLCKYYEVLIKINNDVFLYKPLDTNKDDRIKLIKDIQNIEDFNFTSKNIKWDKYWSVKFSIKDDYYSTKESISNNQLLIK